MKTLYYDDLNGFVDAVAVRFEYAKELNEDFALSIVAMYDLARLVLGKLIRKGYDIDSVSIDPPIWDNYYDEYIITLRGKTIWCEPMKRDDRYLYDEADSTYVSGDCNSACLKYLSKDNVVEFDFNVDICDTEDVSDEVHHRVPADIHSDKVDGYHCLNISYDDGNVLSTYSVGGAAPITEESVVALLKIIGLPS